MRSLNSEESHAKPRYLLEFSSRSLRIRNAAEIQIVKNSVVKYRNVILDKKGHLSYEKMNLISV